MFDEEWNTKSRSSKMNGESSEWHTAQNFLKILTSSSFLSTMLPPTSETLQHALTQGGIPPYLAASPDAKFDSLLSETRLYLQSLSFEHVLEVCLDKATEVFFRSMQPHVFGGSSDSISLSGLADEPRERLAAMLPGLARWCHLALEGLPNELVDVRIFLFLLCSVCEVQKLTMFI